MYKIYYLLVYQNMTYHFYNILFGNFKLFLVYLPQGLCKEYCNEQLCYYAVPL